MDDALLRKVDAVTFHVPDLDAGLGFYEAQLGHKLRWRNDGIGQAALGLPDSETEIVLTTEHGYVLVLVELSKGRPLFRVGRRRFAIFNGLASPLRPRWAESGRSLHFLADRDELDALLQDEGFSRSPHHGDRGWLALRLDVSSVGWEEIAELLHAAHAQVTRGRA